MPEHVHDADIEIEVGQGPPPREGPGKLKQRSPYLTAIGYCEGGQLIELASQKSKAPDFSEAHLTGCAGYIRPRRRQFLRRHDNRCPL